VDDWLARTIGVSSTTAARLLGTIAVLLVILGLRWLAVRAAFHRISDPDHQFRAKRTITYTAGVVATVTLSFIWIDALDNVATFLGLVSAGLTIALGDLFMGLAGWFYVITRHPFRIGDRVEIDGKIGDVVDSRLLRFSLLEIGNWVHADQSTGRIVHIPNGILFKQSLANYTQGFRFIWHELSVRITFESDWERAREVFLAVLERHAMAPEEAMAANEIEGASREFLIGRRDVRPAVYTKIVENGVELTGRLLVNARRRRIVDSALSEELLRLIAAEPGIVYAYPTTRTTVREPLAVRREDAPEDVRSADDDKLR
jgi:small-conductance mechanosensitive channel